MSGKNKKKRRPTCACGRVDIYKEMFKTENQEENLDDSTASCQVEDHITSDGAASGEDQKKTTI